MEWVASILTKVNETWAIFKKDIWYGIYEMYFAMFSETCISGPVFRVSLVGNSGGLCLSG